MSEEDALLSAIAAQPDEDTPRLAYADWLDEHDRHVRAEFIRVQIDIAAHKETLPRVLQNRYVDVWKRNQELIDNHRDELLGPLAGVPGDVQVEFRRGFISEVRTHVWRYMHHADDFARLRPLPVLRIHDVASYLGHPEVSPEQLRPLTLCSAVEMQGPHNPYPNMLTAGQVSDFVDPSLIWDRLRELNCEGCQMLNEGLRLLVESESLPLLANLDLSGNELTDWGVSALLDSRLPRQLRQLVLGGNALTDAAAIELAQRWPTGADDHLEHLNLRFTEIGQPGQQALLARFGGRLTLF